MVFVQVGGFGPRGGQIDACLEVGRGPGPEEGLGSCHCAASRDGWVKRVAGTEVRLPRIRHGANPANAVRVVPSIQGRAWTRLKVRLVLIGDKIL